jgi:carbamoyltransferase
LAERNAGHTQKLQRFPRAGVPLVINTSSNDSEPIVCTPTDAIVTFRKSDIDALFMDDVYLAAQI